MKNYCHLHDLSGPKRVFAFIGLGIGGVLLAAGMALLFGLVVRILWNWLMPALFGLPLISFWQAWGLVVLSHILFKSFPHSGHNHHRDDWKRRVREKCCEPEEQSATRADA